MTAAAPQPIERVRMLGAMAITGKSARCLQAMAIKGRIPGAVKLGGEWTFDELTLRAWIKLAGEAQPWKDVVKPRKAVSGAAKRSGVVRRSKAETTNSAYELAIQKLRGHASKQNGSA